MANRFFQIDPGVIGDPLHGELLAAAQRRGWILNESRSVAADDWLIRVGRTTVSMGNRGYERAVHVSLESPTGAGAAFNLDERTLMVPLDNVTGCVYAFEDYLESLGGLASGST